MKIGMLISNFISLPPAPKKIPTGYSGAPEKIAWQLTEELVRRGHQVTLFASGDTKTSAELVSVSKHASAFDQTITLNGHIDYEYWLIARALERTQKSHHFDLIHSHIPLRSALFAPFFPCPVVATLHSVPESRDPRWLAARNSQHYVAISAQQRKQLVMNYQAIIPHGLDLNNYRFVKTPKNYLVFGGRIVPEKGLEFALDAAHDAGLPLYVFGEVPENQQAYFKKEILPRKRPTDKFFGFQSESFMKKTVASAKALLFPIQWEEPFGLVMIEAMASGTPVIAFRRGSVPEVIQDQKTGFIVSPTEKDGLTHATKKLLALPSNEYQKMREASRKHTEEYFTIEKMVDRYEAVYKKILAKRT